MFRCNLLNGLYIFGLGLILISGEEVALEPNIQFSGAPEHADPEIIDSNLDDFLENITDSLLQNSVKYSDDNDELLILMDIKNIVDMLTTPTDDDSLPCNCKEALEDETESGVYKINMPDSGSPPFFAYCLKSNGGNWMIIQRRMNGLMDFYRDWEYYKRGFGYLNQEYWLGLETLNSITSTEPHEIWFEMHDHRGNKRYAHYDYFLVGDESSNYTLQALGKYTGNAGDSFRYQVGNQFSTKDADNDSKHDGNCAQICEGAWWFGNCRDSHFNGIYRNNGEIFSRGIHWYGWLGRDYSLKYVHMAIRPVGQKGKNS